jgi:hypothetical protein
MLSNKPVQVYSSCDKYDFVFSVLPGYRWSEHPGDRDSQTRQGQVSTLSVLAFISTNFFLKIFFG